MWFPLTLLCALSLAFADACTKRYLSHRSGVELLLVRFSIPALLLLPVLILYGIPPIPHTFWGWMAILTPLELIAMWLYMVAIRDAPLYLTLPYLAFTPAFSIIVGLFILDEQITWMGFMGIALVIVGSYWLNFDRAHITQKYGWLLPLLALWREQGSRLMLIAAIIYSMTAVLSKAAMTGIEPQIFGTLYYIVIGTVTLIIVAMTQPNALQRMHHQMRAQLLIGVLMATMVVTHFIAIQWVEVPYMIAVKRLSLLFGIVIGAFWFKERGTLQHLVAGGLMVLGVFILAES